MSVTPIMDTATRFAKILQGVTSASAAVDSVLVPTIINVMVSQFALEEEKMEKKRKNEMSKLRILSI